MCPALAALQDDGTSARALLRESLQLAESLHDSTATAHAHSRLGMVALLEEDGHEAQALEERSLALCREVDDLRESGIALLNLGGPWCCWGIWSGPRLSSSTA